MIVALSSDEQSVLTVLRVNELAPDVDDRRLLPGGGRTLSCSSTSGADEVIVSSSSAGRLLGMAAEAHPTPPASSTIS